jgi:hypothetical protein
MHTTLSKWDLITWTLVLAIVPYGWTVIGALLMCWMVVQLDNRKDKNRAMGVPTMTTYGDVSLYHKGVRKLKTGRTEDNRETWRNFFDNEDF